MCRAGGRRCPSHNNKLAIQARNAKRRSRYTAAKIESLKNDIQTAKESGDEATAEKLSAQQPELFSKLFLEINESTELSKQYQESIAEESHDEDADSTEDTADDDNTDEVPEGRTTYVRGRAADDDDAITVLNNSAIDDSEFSQNYKFVRNDIDELLDEDLDDEEREEIIDGIMASTKNLSSDEINAAADHLSDRAPEVLDEDESSTFKPLYYELKERAELKRINPEATEDMSIDDIEDIEDFDEED